MTNYTAHVAMMAARHPDAWRTAHTNSPDTERFIRLLASYLHYEIDRNVGLNGKRGNPHDISDDALAVLDPSGDVLDPNGRRMFVIDCIAGAGGPDPRPAWASVGSGGNPGAWVQPERIHDAPQPQPQPNPTPNPGGDLQPVLDAIKAVLDNDNGDHQTLADLIGRLETHLKEQDANLTTIFTRVEVAIAFAERAAAAAEKAATQALVGRTRAFGGDLRLTPEVDNAGGV